MGAGVQEERSDAGFTLLDMMMAMTVMTVVMSVFTSSILSMYRASRTVDARSEAQTQLNTGLQRLDHQIRYAAGISNAYAVGGNPYLDFLTVEDGRRKCVQLRVQNTILAQRSWTYQADPIDLTPWTQLVNGMTYPTPLLYKAPTAAIGHQQLQVWLTVGATADKDSNIMTYTALNTDRTSGNDYCSAARTLP